MQITTAGKKIFEIKDIKCDCRLTGGCEKCRKEVNKLNKIYVTIRNN